MIFVTGDTHGEFDRFISDDFRALGLSKDDYVIICGDFGGVWNGIDDVKGLDFLESLSFNILFVDGNHENHDRLDRKPVHEWCSGKVHFIRDNVIHLMRGQTFEIENKHFFVMGGAASHDIKHGILNPDDPYYLDEYLNLISIGKQVRINGITWWEQELPDLEQLEEGLNSLETTPHIDYIITHCAPTRIQRLIMKDLGNTSYEANYLTDYLQSIYDHVRFKGWYCGHYHCNKKYRKLNVVYDDFIRLC